MMNLNIPDKSRERTKKDGSKFSISLCMHVFGNLEYYKNVLRDNHISYFGTIIPIPLLKGTLCFLG